MSLFSRQHQLIDISTLKGVVETDYVVHADIYVKPGYRKFCAEDVTVRSKDQPTLLKFVLDHHGAACGN